MDSTDTGRGLLPTECDVVVIGGGQAGLAVGWHLLRAKLDFVILDDGDRPGGAWAHGWESLTLFSPAGYSSLPGWPMTSPTHPGFPTSDDVVAYLAAYEARYALPVQRPVKVTGVSRALNGRLRVMSAHHEWLASTVIASSGTWSNPYIPDVPGREFFGGAQLHSARYSSAAAFAGKTVFVVGGGNSGAQIHSEISLTANSTWVTQQPPVFLPDDVDGRVLFDRATAIHRGETLSGLPIGFSSIVMVPSVRAARDRGELTSVQMFARMTTDGVEWPDGTSKKADAIIWCTGFRPSLSYLEQLGIVESDEKVLVTKQGQATTEPKLWLVGFGDWTGFASATLIGCGRMAREVVRTIAAQRDTAKP